MRREQNHLFDTLVMNNEEMERLCFENSDIDETMELFKPCAVYCNDKPIGIVLGVGYGDTDELHNVDVFIFREFISEYFKCDQFEFVMTDTSFDFLSIG